MSDHELAVADCSIVAFNHEDHPYVLWIMSIISLGYVLPGTIFGIYIVQMTKTNGLPSQIEAYMLVAIGCACFFGLISSTNIASLRHGFPNDVLICGTDLSMIQFLVAFICLTLAHSLRIYHILQGEEVVTFRERCIHFTVFSLSSLLILYCVGISVATAARLASVRSLHLSWRWVVTGDAVIGLIISITGIGFIYHFRHKNTIEINVESFLPYKNTWILVIFLASLGIYAAQTEEVAPSGEPCLVTTNDEESVKKFFYDCGLHIMCIVIYCYGPRFLVQRLKSQGAFATLDPRTKLMCLLSIGAVLLNGIVIPQWLNFEAMKIFLLTQMFLVCGVSAYWFRSQGACTSDLEDWCVAGLVCKAEQEKANGRIRTNMQYYLPWVFDVGSNSFLLTSLAAAHIIPWAPGTWIHKFDIFRRIAFDAVEVSNSVLLSCGFAFILCAYYFDALLSFYERLFPSSNTSAYSKVKRCILVFRYLIYKPCLLVGMRVLLAGIKCKEETTQEGGLDEGLEGKPQGGGRLKVNEILVCDGYGWHRVVVHFVLFTVTWCLGMRSITFSHDYLFSGGPTMTQRPQAKVIDTFLRLMIVMLMDIVSPRIIVWIGCIIVIGIMMYQYVYPITLCSRRGNAIQLSITACVLVTHIAGVFNFALPERWIVFIIMLVSVPITACGVYKFGLVYSRTVDSDERIEARVELVRNHNFADAADAIKQLDPRDLGAALHTRAFRSYLSTALQKVAESQCERNVVKGHGDQIVDNRSIGQRQEEGEKTQGQACPGDALVQLGEALSVDCGRRALSFHPYLIPLVVPFLFAPDTQNEAMDAILRMTFVPSAIPHLHTHALYGLLHVWSKVKSSVMHQKAAVALQKIRGGDKIILYSCSASNPTIVSFIEKCEGQRSYDEIRKLPIVGRDVYLVPFYVDVHFGYFTADDPIDAILTFAPHLPFPTRIPRGILRTRPGLCINMDKKFKAFETLLDDRKDANEEEEEEMTKKDTMLRSSRSTMRTILSLTSLTSMRSIMSTVLRTSMISTTEFWSRLSECEIGGYTAMNKEDADSQKRLGAECDADSRMAHSSKVRNLWILYSIEELQNPMAHDAHISELRLRLSKFYVGKLKKWKPEKRKQRSEKML